MTKNREITKTIKGALELLKSNNTEDKILGTVILGKLGKENIKHLFHKTNGECVGTQLRVDPYSNVHPVKIIYVNDCRFWMGSNVLNLIHDEYSPEKDKNNIPAHEYLNFNE